MGKIALFVTFKSGANQDMVSNLTLLRERLKIEVRAL